MNIKHITLLTLILTAPSFTKTADDAMQNVQASEYYNFTEVVVAVQKFVRDACVEQNQTPEQAEQAVAYISEVFHSLEKQNKMGGGRFLQSTLALYLPSILKKIKTDGAMITQETLRREVILFYATVVARIRSENQE